MCTWDVVLSDYSIPQLNFLDSLDLVRSRFPDLPLILVSGSIGEEQAVELLKMGVWDFVLKGSLARLAPAIERGLRDAADRRARKAAEKALSKSEAGFRMLFENMLEGYAQCRMIFDGDRPQDFVYLGVNRAFERLTGLKDVVGKKVSELIPGIRESNQELLEIYGRVALTGRPERFEAYVAPLDIWFSVSVYSTERDCFNAVFDNITERKRAEEAREATIELLRICNEAVNLRELMGNLMAHFHKTAGCEAIGVRLREGEDFPYYVSLGFPGEFVQAENSLCAIDQAGELVRDGSGHPALDCMCGNILCGRFDPAKPFFTPRGSFWSSNTTELLATTTEADRQAKTRNRCNASFPGRNVRPVSIQ
jgi:PAS domain S-box-containing protein